MSEISEKLRVARENVGLTQQELANKTGIGYKTINNYEKSVSRPDVEKLAVLCDALEVSADYLISTQLELTNKIFINENINENESHLLNEFHKLNSTGQDEAIKRVEELTHFDKYTTKEHLRVVAAHLNGEMTEEKRKTLKEDIEMIRNL